MEEVKSRNSALPPEALQAKATQTAMSVLKQCEVKQFFSLEKLGARVPSNVKPQFAFYPVWAEFASGYRDHPRTLFIMIVTVEGQLIPRLVSHTVTDWVDGWIDRTSTHFRVYHDIADAKADCTGHTMVARKAVESKCFEKATALATALFDKGEWQRWSLDHYITPGRARAEMSDDDRYYIEETGTIEFANRVTGYTGD